MPVKASKLIEEWTKKSPEEKEKQIEELQLKSKEESENWNKRVSILFPTSINIAKEQAAIAAIQRSDPTDFQAIATHMLELSNDHYTSVRTKSEKSFSWTIRAYSIALFFFLAAATLFIFRQTNVSYFTALGAALTGLFGGLIQAQGKQVDKEAKECRINLDRIQRFIIANSACESLNDSEKQQTRSEIIKKLVE